MKRPLLAGEREDARYATSAQANAILMNSDVSDSSLEAKRLRCSGPSTFERATPAVERSLLAREREDVRYAAFAPASRTDSSPEPGELGPTEPIPAERPATGQPFFAEKQSEAGYAAPQLVSLPQQERERMPSWYASGNESKRSLAPDTELGHPKGVALGCVGSSGKSERESPLPPAKAAVNKSEIAMSDESLGAVPKVETSARITDG